MLTCICLSTEWRSGQAGHLTLSDDDVTAVVQGCWKRLNTLQHYKVPIDQVQGGCVSFPLIFSDYCDVFVPKVPDGATVALIPQSSSGGVHQVFQTGESKEQ